jgi:hypothetical protein
MGLYSFGECGPFFFGPMPRRSKDYFVTVRSLSKTFVITGKTYELNFCTYKGAKKVFYLAVPLPQIPDPKLTPRQLAHVKKNWWTHGYHLTSQQQAYEHAADAIAYKWYQKYKLRGLGGVEPVRFYAHPDRAGNWWLLSNIYLKTVNGVAEIANTTVKCAYCTTYFVDHVDGYCVFVQDGRFKADSMGIEFLDKLPLLNVMIKHSITQGYRKYVREEVAESLRMHRRQILATRCTIKSFRDARLRKYAGYDYALFPENGGVDHKTGYSTHPQDLLNFFQTRLMAAYAKNDKFGFPKREGQMIHLDQSIVELAKAVLKLDRARRKKNRHD